MLHTPRIQIFEEIVSFFFYSVTGIRKSAMNWRWQMDNSTPSLTRWPLTRKKLWPSGRNKWSRKVSTWCSQFFLESLTFYSWSLLVDFCCYFHACQLLQLQCKDISPIFFILSRTTTIYGKLTT